MLRSRFVVLMFPVGLMLGDARVVSGQTYPNKPIRMVTSSAGSGNDFVARLIEQGLKGSLGQQVIIDNRGGGGVIPGQIVFQAPADGYTLLLKDSTLWLLPFMRDNVPYDPVKDFSPIAWTTDAPNILVVHPSLPVKSAKELIALSKTRPGALNYSAGPAGSTPHLAAELFKAMAGVNIVGIPFTNASARMASLISGEVQMEFTTMGPVAPHLKLGRLRALAITSARPSALIPEVPTVSASGLPGYESGTSHGLFAPANTPKSIINRLNQEIVRVLNQPEVKQKFATSGIETIGGSPDELAVKMKSDMVSMGKVIKAAGIRAD